MVHALKRDLTVISPKNSLKPKPEVALGAPSKVHTIQLVKIQAEERLAITSEQNLAS